MNILTASANGHKIAATREATVEIFTGIPLDLSGHKVNSGVNEEPEGLEETLDGALNRLDQIRSMAKAIHYDLLVASQNGVFAIDKGRERLWFDTAWIAVEDADGNQSFAPTTGVQFETADVEEARRRGFTKTTVGQVMAERLGIDPTDPQGTLTNGLLNRSDILRDGLRAAIGQLLRKSPKLKELIANSKQ